MPGTPPSFGSEFWTSAAFWTAAVALLSFVLSKVYELVLRRWEWEGRKAAIVRFRTDIRLRRDDLLSKREAYDDPVYQNGIITLIDQHSNGSMKFRLYGVEVSDTKAQDEITTILRDRQMVALYDMTTSAAFGAE